MALSVEDRQRLSDQIRDWNESRLQLFEISQPTKNGEFFGVIRFFFQEAGEKVATKCIRISNSMSTRDIINILVEKFRPDMRMLTTGTYALYEVHFSEERKLSDEEVPLLVQLSWSKGDREGRFLLKNESEPQQPPKEEMKRRLSKREKKEARREPPKAVVTASGPVDGKENKPRVGETLYKEVPETSFTRTVSNPEAVMRRRRQQKLEKLQQVQRQEGGARGNIIKIFGEMIDPSIPYKTVLLSRQDTAAHVVRDMLIKYGRDQDNPANYCLLLVQLQPTQAGQELQRVECVLQDTDSPLVVAQQMQPEYIRFEICPRNRLPPNNSPQRAQQQANNNSLQRSASAELLSRQGGASAGTFPYLREMAPDGRDLPNGNVFGLDAEVTDVGSMPHMPNSHGIQILGPGIQPRHCVIARMDGIVTVTPIANDADTFVDNRRIHETTMLEHGSIIRFGHQTVFRFIDPNAESSKPNAGSRPPMGAVRVLPPNAGPVGQQSPVLIQGLAQSIAKPAMPQVLPGSLDQLQLDELPASLIVGDQTEDRFLSYVVLDSQSTNSQFRLSPAFVLYMVSRFRLTSRYQPHPPIHWQDRPQKVMTYLEKVGTMIRRAIHAKPADVGYLAFWLANSSELLNFLRCDLDLLPLSESSRSILTEAVQMSFHYLVNAVHLELNKVVLPSFFADNDDDLQQDRSRLSSSSSLAQGISDVVQLLTLVMSLSRRCRINAGLTIQLFSHWFHFINHRIFNTLIQMSPRYNTRAWGSRVLRRLNAVHAWAEKNGLELAVDTHLERARQAAVLLESPKDSPSLAPSLAARICRLNSVQLKALLDGSAHAVDQGFDKAHISRQFVESVLAAARQTADEALRAAGFDVSLYEREDLNARFLMPDDGYASDVTKDIPPGLQDFVQPLITEQICVMNLHQGVSGAWTVYFSKRSGFLDGSAQQQAFSQQQTQIGQTAASNTPNRMSQHLESQHPPHSPSYQVAGEPPMITVQLQKVNNSLGLSIVAARGEVNKQRGIYVKSVVPSGAAYLDGRIKEGDQLVEVDGRSLQGLTQESAAEILVSTGHVVHLLVAKQAAMYHGVAMLLGQANLQNQPLPYQQGQISPTQKVEYARPRSRGEDSKNPQQQMANIMTQSFSGSYPNQQPQPQMIQRMPVQHDVQTRRTSDQFVAPSYENWTQSGPTQPLPKQQQQQQQQQQQSVKAEMSNSTPNLLNQTPYREILPISMATRMSAGDASSIPKVDIQAEALQPSFYANTTVLREQHAHFERMPYIINENYEHTDVPPYRPPSPERRMLVPLPQIPLVEVKAEESQPEFFRALRQPRGVSPAKPPASDSNYMHLSDLSSVNQHQNSRARLSSSGSSHVPLLQPPRSTPPQHQPPSSSLNTSLLSSTSTFSTTIGQSRQTTEFTENVESRRVVFGSVSSMSKEPSSPATTSSLLSNPKRLEQSEYESRPSFGQPDVERRRQLKFSEPLRSGLPENHGSNEDLENRRSSLQTKGYRDVEAERRREEEIEQNRIKREMERVHLRKNSTSSGLSGSPTPATTTPANARLVSSTHSTPVNASLPAPTSALAGGLLSGSYTVSSPSSSPKPAPKLNIVPKPVPPPVAPKPFSGPKPYRPSVAPKPAMSSSLHTASSGPLSSWRPHQSPSPPPPPLPSSPPPMDLPDEYERRHISPPSGVIGKGEVYRDPRDRILQERAHYEQHESTSSTSGAAPSSASRLTFHDKMRLFAHEAGESTPKDRPKASRTQLQIQSKIQQSQ